MNRPRDPRHRRRHHPTSTRAARRRAIATPPGAVLLGAALLGAAVSPATTYAADPPGDVGAVLDDAVGRYPASEQPALRMAAGEAISAGAGEPVLAEFMQRAAGRGLDASWVIAVLGNARRLGESRLPIEPVLDRYLQGLSKGVAPARIDAVARQLEERLAEGARQVDRVFTATRATERERLAMIDHAGYALGTGVPVEAIAATLEMVAGERLGMMEARGPVIALGCLAAGGLELERSRELVRSAWQTGFRGAEIEQLAMAVGAIGRQQHDALPAIVDALLTRLHRGDERQAILEQLETRRRESAPGHRPPGSAPGEDPGEMRGPGGPPEDPGHQHPGGSGPGGGGGHGGHQGGGG